MQTQYQSAVAAATTGPSASAAAGLYQFVYFDQAGHVLASDPSPYRDDEAAQAHAHRLLAGATLVVVYRDDAQVSLLANLC